MGALLQLLPLHWCGTVGSADELGRAIEERLPPLLRRCVSGARDVRVWVAPSSELPYEGLLGHVAHSGETIVVGDTAADRIYSAAVDGTALEGVPTITVPLLAPGPAVVGALRVAGAAGGERFDGEDALALARRAEHAVETLEAWRQRRASVHERPRR